VRFFRVERTLVCFKPQLSVIFNLTRSAGSPQFSAREQTILAVVSAHANNLYRCFQKIQAPSLAKYPTADTIRDRFSCLTRREAEVLALSARGLSAPEIATKFFLATRTVESHFAHAYDKLNIHSKREVLRLLWATADNEEFPVP